MIVNAGYRGKVGAAAPKFTYTGQYNIRKDGVVELLTSGTITFLSPTVIDIFCVGGGGAGGSSQQLNYTKGLGGGGGGYTATAKKQSVSGQIEVVIGAGGIAGPTPTNGGNTSFGTLLTANGGYSGRYNVDPTTVAGAGQNGGSGGGGGRYSSQSFDNYGGSDGENGAPATAPDGYYAKGGNGQGSTTREFGEPNGKLYAGGGGGGTYFYSPSPVYAIGGAGGGGAGAWDGAAYGTQAAGSGAANTGGGGGGGAYGGITKGLPGNGGSGIVCFRDAQELPELAGTWVLNERLYPTENKLLETVNVSNGGSNYTKISIDPVTNKNLTLLAGVGGKILYYFNNNTWNGTDHTLIFPSGATASEEFRAWLASNATKQ